MIQIPSEGYIPKQVVIDREQWIRGEGSDVSYLLRSSDGMMCCLGFSALQCGWEKCEINNTPSPNSAGWKDLTEKDGYVTANVLNIRKMMNVNDDEVKGNELREIELIRLAKLQGWEFVFVN